MCTQHLPVPQPSLLTHHHKGHKQRAEPFPLMGPTRGPIPGGTQVFISQQGLEAKQDCGQKPS